MNMGHVLNVIKGLDISSFYKSMTAYSDNPIWQDVYHAEWEDRSLYVKFQRVCEYFIVPFRDL